MLYNLNIINKTVFNSNDLINIVESLYSYMNNYNIYVINLISNFEEENIKGTDIKKLKKNWKLKLVMKD